MYSTTTSMASQNSAADSSVSDNITISTSSTLIKDNAEIIKSQIDDRDYRIIELSNQLKVVLVSDKNADKAAVSLDVSVGSGSDPKDAQGLAHFLEHMLFLGNEKFPEPGEYQAFIQQHGGGTNAFTAYDQTNYFFDINGQYLEPALDRFSQFFISPLFNQEYAERERNIVDSEYNARRTNEYRRTFSARKEIFNDNHPITKFSIGNNQTLADTSAEDSDDTSPIQQKLIEFYQQYYSASIMGLTIISHHGLDELEALANRYFSAIANNGYQVELLSESLYQPGALPKLLHVNPLKDQSSLTLSFPMPEVESLYKTKPSYYLSNLLGHEGEGSLLSYLKEQGWALSLSAGLELSHREESSFAVNVNLTDKGMQQWQRVVEVFYQYVAMLSSDDIHSEVAAKRLYQEQSRITSLDFDFQQRIENTDYAVAISHQIKHYPAAEVLSAPALLEQFDFPLIKKYLGHINPSNMLIILVDQGLETDAVTQYYDTKYKINELDEAWLSSLLKMNIDSGSMFSLPTENIFIAEDASMLAENNESFQPKPKKLQDKKGFQFWHQTDTSFGAPRANFYISIRSPIIGDSAKTQVLNQLYTRVVNEQLNEYLYPAYLADLNVSIYPHMRGITIRMGGFNDKQDLLIEPVFDALFNQPIDKKLFERKKEEIVRQYKDAVFSTPYQTLFGRGNDLFLKNSWPTTLKLDVVNDINEDDLEAFRLSFIESLDIVALHYGNVDESSAKKNSEIIEALLPKKTEFKEVEHTSIAKLNDADYYLNFLDVRHEDNAVIVVAQSQQKDIREKAKMYLLYQLIDSAFYHELRTVQQLGYIVSANPYSSLEYTGIAFIVESSSHSEVEIYQAIDDFINTIGQKVAQVDDEQYASLKKGLISKINKRDENLEGRTNRLWHEIDRNNVNFNSREQLIAAIESMTKSDIETFAQNVYGENRLPQNYSRLILSTKHQDDNAEELQEALKAVNQSDTASHTWQVIDDIAEFKNTTNYHSK